MKIHDKLMLAGAIFVAPHIDAMMGLYVGLFFAAAGIAAAIIEMWRKW